MRDTIYVNATAHVEKRPPRHKRRTYFFAQNLSANDVYYEEQTMADPNRSIKLGAGQFIELWESQGDAVPQGNVWFLGSVASPATQQIQIKEA